MVKINNKTLALLMLLKANVTNEESVSISEDGTEIRLKLGGQEWNRLHNLRLTDANGNLTKGGLSYVPFPDIKYLHKDFLLKQLPSILDVCTDYLFENPNKITEEIKASAEALILTFPSESGSSVLEVHDVMENPHLEINTEEIPTFTKEMKETKKTKKKVS
jgi:hypothetical protein